MVEKPVVLFADSSSDLGDALQERYNVQIIPIHVVVDGKTYDDGKEISTDAIYQRFYDEKLLPKTAAINPNEYMNAFTPWIEKGYEVVYIGLGGALSSCMQSSFLVAEEMEGVYPVDSCNLSTGIGLLVIRAAELIAEGKSAAEVQQEIKALTGKSHASFILDTLTFLSAGGRCSAVTALAASLLNLKPCIRVDNKDGSMGVGKKYRGKLIKVLEKYVEEELSSYGDTLDTSRIFITHSGIDEECIEAVRARINSMVQFDEIHVTRASSTISCHCGPNTLGILFMTK